jgi:hypothetical protein
MLYNIVRFYCQHRWVVGAAHFGMVIVLFVVCFTSHTVLEFATSLSRLPADVRIRMYLFALVLLASVYATLVLDLTLRQQWEDSKGARLHDVLLGVWESTGHNEGREQRRMQLVVSFDAVYGRIATGTADEATTERVEITDVVAGDLFLLHTSRAPTNRQQAAQPGTWRLEFVAPAMREPYLVAWRDDAGQGNAEREPQHVTLRKLPGG